MYICIYCIYCTVPSYFWKEGKKEGRERTKRERDGEAENITKRNVRKRDSAFHCPLNVPMHLRIHTFKPCDVSLQWAEKEKVKKQRTISH